MSDVGIVTAPVILIQIDTGVYFVLSGASAAVLQVHTSGRMVLQDVDSVDIDTKI